MWGRSVDGQVLRFRLAGINNQNFLMRDEETGSVWQQVTGEAIAGPLRGKRLAPVASDELRWGRARRESPATATVLRGEAAREAAGDYDRGWEAAIAGLPTVVDVRGSALAPRALVVGLEIDGVARAYPIERLREEVVVVDEVGDAAVLLWMPDADSLRVFRRRLRGDAAAIFSRDGDRIVDAASGSAFGFDGCASAGPRAGECLERLQALKDFWFDWRLYHPETTIYGLDGPGS